MDDGGGWEGLDAPRGGAVSRGRLVVAAEGRGFRGSASIEAGRSGSAARQRREPAARDGRVGTVLSHSIATSTPFLRACTCITPSRCGKRRSVAASLGNARSSLYTYRGLAPGTRSTQAPSARVYVRCRSA